MINIFEGLLLSDKHSSFQDNTMLKIWQSLSQYEKYLKTKI